MRLSLRARLLVVPAVVVTGAVALLTMFEHASQRDWLIERESASLVRLARESARTIAPLDSSWQSAADSLDARFDLRAKLGDHHGVIETVLGAGYKLTAPAAPADA